MHTEPGGPDLLIRNVNVATMADTGEAYGVVRDGLVVVVRRADHLGRGCARAASSRVATAGASRTPWMDEGGWLTPGLVDCHTHVVFAGTRADEFEMRLRGRSYEEIARAGGGDPVHRGVDPRSDGRAAMRCILLET